MRELKKILRVKQAPKFKNRKRDKGANNNGKKGLDVTKSEKNQKKKSHKKAAKANSARFKRRVKTQSMIFLAVIKLLFITAGPSR